MKKKIMAILLACMVMFAFAACGNNQNEDENQDAAVLEDTICINVEGYSIMGGMLNFTMNDGTVEEMGAWAFLGKEGETFGDVLTRSEVSSVEPVLEGDTFEGWVLFEEVVTLDEEGFESYSYELRSGDTVYSTEEMMEVAVPGYNVTVVAKWAGISLDTYFTEDDYMWEAGVTTGAVTFIANEGMITFQTSAGDTYDSSVYTYWMEDGTTLNDVMASGEWDTITEVKKEGAEFAGWMVYEADSITWDSTEINDGSTISLPFDEYEGFEYIVLENGKEFNASMTTEELCALVNESRCYVAVANWK